MHPILSAFVDSSPVAAALAQLRDGSESGSGAATVSLTAGARASFIAAAATPVTLVITATSRESEDLADALGRLIPAASVAVFPSWETLPHERLSPRSDTVGKRLAVLRRLAHPEASTESDDSHPWASHGPVHVLVAPVRSVLQPLARGLGDLMPVTLRVGEEHDFDGVVESLAGAAYTRTDLVERRGEFAVRGGIIDVFPPTQEHPIRVEFFGDVVDEIRSFRVADQRTVIDAADPVVHEGLWAPPCRELLLSEQVRERAEELIPRLPGVADMLTKMAAGVAVEGMESLTPALVDGMESILDVLPAGARVMLCDPERVRTRAHDLVATSEEFLDAGWSTAAAGTSVPIDLREVLGQSAYRTMDELRDQATSQSLPWWDLTPFDADADTAPGVVATGTTATKKYRGDADAAVADLKQALTDDWRVVAVMDGPGSAQRLAEILGDSDIAARIGGPDEALASHVVNIRTGSLGSGFSIPDAQLLLLTESDLSGSSASGPSTKDMRRMPSRRRNQVDPLALRPGDLVVHEQHGVGRFVEMVQRSVAGATREYLVLEYAPSKRGHPADRLFVPTDQLDQISRYVGGEAPTLNKLGGSDWQATKSRARRHVKQIAGELIKLYSARMATAGHAFGPDTPWQRELEDAFAHVETPDQLVTIDEVKADMERPVPMDRLICGDVGYGKTEIAVRAGFKAIQEGKQVAVLVPTTLLVQQHLQTFSERYAAFPVTVKALSRFQTDAQAREVIAGLADGSIDCVIGTHRLLSGEVKFKDLGLVVVDEEQRFGVEHKELLKSLRTAVDVLAMSATPIPRTLEMAVTGIRDMSTLATPPEERHPVLTYVGGYEEQQVTAAIRRELLREGQVFFVHNKVDSIDRTAARLRELVPEARVATAHGRMGEQGLEQVVVDFWEREFDVLVTTTIVETGLDISNANTLIVDRADRLGLSQLHQLRGRVGRGRERAYAYFLYPQDKPLTDTAADRLETIATNTDLGSGMQIAMKDLEIRGAGNLLGGEQSGHIAGVGFDLYVRLVGEAVATFRGEGDSDPVEVKIELPVNAHLPHDYVPGERLRLEAYRKLAAVTDQAELEDIEAELVDRYGPAPEPVRHLIDVARLRTVARSAGIHDIATQGNHVRFSPVELRESQQLRLERLYPKTIVKEATRSILVPRPMTAPVAGSPLRDSEVLRWATDLVEAVLLDNIAASASAATTVGS